MPPKSDTTASLDTRHAEELGGEPVIDRATFSILESLADEDDPDLVAEIVQLFLEDSAIRMAQIKEGAGGGNADSIQAAAHALKSASANVGALCLSAVCAKIEGVATSCEESELTALVDMAVQMHADVRRVLSVQAA